MLQYNKVEYNSIGLTVCVSQQSVEGVLGTNNYQHNKVNQWTSAVVEQCLNQLTKLAKPFKYIGMSSIKVLMLSL